MRCVNCGAELTDKNAVFCDKCYKEAMAKNTGKSSVPDKKPMSASNNKNNTNNKNKKTKKSKKKIIISITAIIIAIIILAITIPAIWLGSVFGKFNKSELSGNLGITEKAEFPFSDDVKNIALYGLDTRERNFKGRSDAIIVLSVDRTHNAIKLSSIARDTYISFESGKHDKITHAWAYGKQNLAVKTLNSNFNLDITDYVAVNFFLFADIIDYLGGVYVDVNSGEMNVMNTKYIPYIKALGIDCELVTETGYQLLNGGQALAYARDRYTGSDFDRGNRQREILEAMFDAAKKLSPSKYPKLIDMVAEGSVTSLSGTEMYSIGLWALTNSPKIYSLGLPNDECNSKGQMINGTSYVVYDLENASKILHNFIYDYDGKVVSSNLASQEQ